MNILGITVSSTLTFHHHISALVTKSIRSLYALKTIRAHGLDGNALWDVIRAIHWSHNSCMQAMPNGAYIFKADEKNRLQSVVKKAIRYGYLPRFFSTLSEISQDSDKKNFFWPGITSCPNPKPLSITCVSAHTTLHYLQMSVRSSNKTLSIECCSVISINHY